MRVFLTLCISTLISSWSYATNDEIFGSGADMSSLTPISQLLVDPESYTNKTVTVKGSIQSVCGNKGCWMTLSSDEQRLRIKVKDGEMVFPFNARGKIAYATGKLEALPMSKEKAIAYLSHMAEESDETFDPASVTGDITLYQLRPVGVTIKH